MAWVDTLTNEIEDLLSTTWNERDGNVIPTTETISLTDGSVKIEAAFLYADLAGSSILARHCVSFPESRPAFRVNRNVLLTLNL